MKRVVVVIICMLAPFTSCSADITKETPIAYYSMTNLVPSEEIKIYTAALFRELSEAIEGVV